MNFLLNKPRSQKITKFILILFFLAFFDFQTADASTFVSGEILTDTVWTKTGSPYVVEDYLEVGEGVTLSIEPGAVVKFNQSYIDVYGKITALGTSQDKIYFTSFLDDSVGGDTNNDNSATAPSSGDWYGMNFYSPSTGSEFEHADFKYASVNFYLDSSDLKIASSSVSFVSNYAIDSIESNLKIVGNIFDSNYYGIETVGGNMILVNNNFTKNYMPVYADYETVLENAGNSMSGNEFNGIGLYGDLYYIESDKIFHKDVPYIFFDELSINKNSTVTIEPGVVIKPFYYDVEIDVYGTLKAVGSETEPIILTSLDDDEYGGDTNGDGDNSSPGSQWGDWEGLYFGRFSSASQLKNIIVKYAEDIYFDSVNLKMDRMNFENNYNAVFIYNGNVKIEDSILRNNKNGIMVYEGSLDLRNSNILNTLNTAGINVWQAGEVNIIGSNISGNDWNGIYLDSASTTISGNFIFGNNDGGIYMATSAPATIYGNDIYDNSGFGIYKSSSILVATDAINNWWGDKTGPYHAILNPDGKGNAVSDGVIFKPWLTDSIKKPIGFSSVAFIPGIEASRLYRQGFLFENQLWEPNRNDDARKLFLDKDGKSIDTGIYTRDIIKETNVPVSADGFGLNIYKKFSESMDKMVADKEIKEWKALPYDWRFNLSDIVNGGVKQADGNISYIDGKPDGQLPFMIAELEELAKNSHSGKVTIITHSNGGLVAKALIKKLAEMKADGGSDLIDKINRLIMVAAPQTGTPQAIAGMLHGDGQDLGFGLILNKSVARELAENMPGAYNLLPSEKYFGVVLDPVIKFDSSVDNVSMWRSVYGNFIADFQKMSDFVLGKEGREEPDSANVDAPNVLNGKLLDISKNTHTEIDDWQIPANIEVSQIAGWGLDTVSGIEYYAKMECVPVAVGDPLTGDMCENKYVLDHRPIFTSDGDETIVTPSATMMEGERYYLDVWKYNDVENDPRTHKDIFEIQPLEDLLKNIITGSTTTLPSYITHTKPESESKKLRLSVHSPVSIDVYDSLGNHTGIIPNPDPNSDLELVEESIPNSYYMNFGEGKYVGFESGEQNKIELNGLGAGTFTLEIGEYAGDREATSTAFVDIPVTSALKAELNIQNLDTLPQLKIDVEGDGVIDFEITPSGEFDPILFLEIMKKTIKTFDLKKSFEKNLINKIDNLIKSIKKGKIKQVEKKIKGFIKKIESKKKHNKKIGSEEREAILSMLNQLLNNF